MAAQQSVKRSTKKHKNTKKVALTKELNEGSSSPGNTSNFGSTSSTENSKLSTNSDSTTSKAKQFRENETKGKESRKILPNVNKTSCSFSEDSLESILSQMSIVTNNVQNVNIAVGDELNSVNDNSVLSKSKKKRLRKRKLHLENAGVTSDESITKSTVSSTEHKKNVDSNSMKKAKSKQNIIKIKSQLNDNVNVHDIKDNKPYLQDAKLLDKDNGPLSNSIKLSHQAVGASSSTSLHTDLNFSNLSLNDNVKCKFHSKTEELDSTAHSVNSNIPLKSNHEVFINTLITSISEWEKHFTPLPGIDIPKDNNVEEYSSNAHVNMTESIESFSKLQTNDLVDNYISNKGLYDHVDGVGSKNVMDFMLTDEVSHSNNTRNIVADQIFSNIAMMKRYIASQGIAVERAVEGSKSKFEGIEKLLSSTISSNVSSNLVDRTSSKNVSDFMLTKQVADSSDMLQVDDKTNIVAENSCNKGVTFGKGSLQEVRMESNNDSSKIGTQSAKLSKEEVKAAREARRAAKAVKKGKGPATENDVNKVNDTVDGCIIPRKSVEINIAKDDVKVASNEKQLVTQVSKTDPKEKHDINLEAPKKDTTEKSKAELRAERRAKQEAQRAAKSAQKETQSNENITVTKEKKTEEIVVKEDEIKEGKEESEEPRYKAKLFSHLYFEKTLFQDNHNNLHPAVLQLGAQYESRVIMGSNARCLALLHALKQMVNDYSTPSKQEFSRGLESMLVQSMNYINSCRPASVSMINVVRHIKRHLTQLPNTISDSEARNKLYEIIDTYIREQIDVAGEAICNTVQKKINNGDVILTYGCSSLIFRILVESHRSGTKFSVVVVDGGPWFEGREMLRRLVKEGLNCSYILLTAASFIMREASKVLLGAHALLANGYVMSRAGTSQVALLARSYDVPVLVCCETHKFSERVLTDAFVHNELGDPDEFIRIITGSVSDWRSYNCLTPLSIAFDVTPPDLVTAVVTELGILPCTSVPVILRIKPSESV